MSLSIYNNVTSLDAQRSLTINQRNLSKNMAHLSSGLRVNDASDDAAGLAIAEQMQSDVRAYAQAGRNANDGVSMMLVAGGAMNQQAALLTRMKELAVEASNGTLGDDQKDMANTEFQALINEVDRIGTSTTFNGTALMTTASGLGVNFQVGVTSSDTVTVTIDQVQKTALGADATDISSLDISHTGDPSGALDTINDAITSLAKSQAAIGAGANQLTSAADTDATFQVNLQAAESRIRDVDVAAESADMARNNILVQAGTAVLAQANQLPQAALTLLRG